MDRHRLMRGTLAAVLAATAIPTLVSVAIAPGFTPLVAIFALIMASAHAYLIGLPAYMLLKRLRPLRWWHAVLGGAVIGAAPIAFFTRSEGPVEVLRTVMLLAPLGAVSGFSFWWAGWSGHARP